MSARLIKVRLVPGKLRAVFAAIFARSVLLSPRSASLAAADLFVDRAPGDVLCFVGGTTLLLVGFLVLVGFLDIARSAFLLSGIFGFVDLRRGWTCV